MKREDINIRDPYVLVDDGKYYLYGTRSKTCWGPAEGFDCYVSSDLEHFEGPIEIFKRPEDFFATECFWAPECYKVDGAYYLVTTFAGQGIKKGIYVLKADSPTGPFSLYSERLTPDNWTCIDGTLLFENDKVYLIFSHSFEDALDGTGNADGDYCYLELSKDLKKSISDIKKMFAPKGTYTLEYYYIPSRVTKLDDDLDVPLSMSTYIEQVSLAIYNHDLVRANALARQAQEFLSDSEVSHLPNNTPQRVIGGRI